MPHILNPEKEIGITEIFFRQCKVGSRITDPCIVI
jgi:hypothetical protein